MASRKRKACGWSAFQNKSKSEHGKQTSKFSRGVIHRDRLNLPALLIGRKETDKTNQLVTFLLGNVNPGCIGASADSCKWVDDDGEGNYDPKIIYTPKYFYGTKKTFESRMSWIEETFPILPEDNYELVPGRFYQAYCKKSNIPDQNFVMVNLIDFRVDCTVQEPYDKSAIQKDVNEGLVKGFFVKMTSMDVISTVSGTKLLKILYAMNAITRQIVPFDERREEIGALSNAAAAYADKNSSLGSKIMKEYWDDKPWQQKTMLQHNPFILQLGSKCIDLKELFSHKPCGSDEYGRVFEFTPLGIADETHEDDVMSFTTRTSQTDETPIHAWTFIAHVFQASVKPESIEKNELEEVLGEDDVEYLVEHTIKVAIYRDTILTLGTPCDLDDHKNMISIYYNYFPFALSCRLDSKRSINRPENNEGLSAYATRVEELVGPVAEFWETVGIPVSKAMAFKIEEQYPGGTYMSRDSMESAKFGIYCISNIQSKEIAKSTINATTEEETHSSLFVVICRKYLDNILPYQYAALKEFDVWDVNDARQGDIVIESIFFDYEDFDEDENPKAKKLLDTFDFFEDAKWDHLSKNYIRPYVYSTRKPNPPTIKEIEYITSFVGAD